MQPPSSHTPLTATKGAKDEARRRADDVIGNIPDLTLRFSQTPVQTHRSEDKYEECGRDTPVRDRLWRKLARRVRARFEKAPIAISKGERDDFGSERQVMMPALPDNDIDEDATRNRLPDDRPSYIPTYVAEAIGNTNTAPVTDKGSVNQTFRDDPSLILAAGGNPIFAIPVGADGRPYAGSFIGRAVGNINSAPVTLNGKVTQTFEPRRAKATKHLQTPTLETQMEPEQDQILRHGYMVIQPKQTRSSTAVFTGSGRTLGSMGQ